ncbi:hypothetical protein WJX74_002997 [Apatococcus lobatus]|uniref:t-SNARE coiled-coil homology domain-containing protein n=2 Tax=Apatococcus TaxID=904362 RepID=A0AAW1SP93_9CHLO
MNQGGPRDRRPANQAAALDLESQEQENDKGIDALGDRVSMLRQLTSGIKGEVDSHHRLLDNMASDMTGSSAGLAGTFRRFKSVFEAPRERQSALVIVGCVGVLLVIYFLIRRSL